MTERPIPTSKDIYPAEHDQKVQGIKNLVEKRVLAASTSFGVPDLTAEFQNLSTREKADLLYEKLMAYSVAARIMREEQKQTGAPAEPIDPYLVREIKALWQDQPTQNLFTDRAAEARIDVRLHRASQTGRRWKEVNSQIAETRKVFEEETRRLFLQQVTRPDQISAAQGRTARFAQELIRLQQGKKDIISLKGVPHTFENTAAVANIMYETLAGYSDELDQGFVWLPSRLDIHVATVEALQNGRWPVLRGEAGTGKSEQADAAAVVLTAEQPTHLACSQNTAERDLIADKEIDPATGGSYEEYGAPMQAATGYENSTQTEPKFKTGRVVRLDESGRLGDKGYAVIKELRQKRPASPEDIRKFKEGKTIDPDKMLNGKPVLPGFAAIFTTNPEGARYPNRTEPDAALRRELSYITVDYADMNDTNPELYEFMLGALMDQKHHIAVAKSELEPYYTLVPQNDTLPDGRKIIARQQLAAEANDPKHGILYRLSFALRNLQDSFSFGNMETIPDTALRYEIKEGKVTIVKTDGEPLTLANSTVTLGEIASWMRGFNQRRLKDDPNYQVSTLTDWIKLKLKTYLSQVDELDRDKIRAIFEHYHLFDDAPDLTGASPVTPKEIGYLSPRVPRPLHLAAGRDGQKSPPPASSEQPWHDDRRCLLEDGNHVMAQPKSMQLVQSGGNISLRPGSRFSLGGQLFQFVGLSPDHRVVALIDTGRPGEAIHRLFDASQLTQQGEFNRLLEEAQRIFGDDFFGQGKVEQALKITIAPEHIPKIPFSLEELERAKELGQYLILRVDADANGTPLTMKYLADKLQRVFDSGNKGKILYNVDWYQDDPFYDTTTPMLKWALVSKTAVPDSTGVNYLEQTKSIAAYLKNTVFHGQPISSEYQAAFAELDSQKGIIARLIDPSSPTYAANWKEGADRLARLKITRLTRQLPVEAIYDFLVYFQNTNDERLLENIYAWTAQQTRDGRLVDVGGSDSGGALVNRWRPVHSGPSFAAFLSR